MYVNPINSVVPAGVGSGTQFQRTMPTNRSASNLADSLDSFTSTFTSTSPPFSKPAMIVPSGWTPKEAKTMPTAAERAAGMRGVIDNTVRFKPLPPMYGKSKEYHRGENQAKVHLTAPDTLAETKGLKHSDYPPFGPAECVPAVLTQYSKPVPLQYKMDPMRIDSGFIASPQLQRGMRAIPSEQALTKLKPTYQIGISPSASPSSTMSKFEFDLTASAKHIPVARRFHIGA
ncbi:hypothetical protein Ctob_005926 [Chrysochromulina tobinii]|uniref:Uncharacterized protein n=1 Tax=Chrysochromulina tobinii TaxID=1460289 RepID=A0A0M0JWV4_9EUKA|nr:hypothetical protein Ctob_005926 [Chrysochromulina tobinii]|eukprot:KOO30618.1 hypothetical protein Ctob_005926 [Chrysochromulina sp. CCMP291]